MSNVFEIYKSFTDTVLNDVTVNRYIKSIVLVGSAARNELNKFSDIDILVIIDDASVLDEISAGASGNPEAEAETFVEHVEGYLRDIARRVSRRLSIHVYTLTKFTEYVSKGHPIVYNFVKDGKPLYDMGFFTPWKILLKRGEIPGTRENVERYMKEAFEALHNAKAHKLVVLLEIYRAMTYSAQAILMSLSRDVPSPNKLASKIKEAFVDKGMLDSKYVVWLEEIMQLRREVERGNVKKVLRTFPVKKWIDRASEFVFKSDALLYVVELLKAEEALSRTYEVMYIAFAAALKALHGLPKEMSVEELEKRLGMNVKEAFKKEFIDTQRVDPNYLEVIERVENLKKEIVDNDDISVLKDKVDEVYQLREKIRSLIYAIGKTIRFELPKLN